MNREALLDLAADIQKLRDHVSSKHGNSGDPHAADELIINFIEKLIDALTE